MIRTTTTITANTITKATMVELLDQVRNRMSQAVDDGGNLEVAVEAKWDSNQPPRQDRFRATVKHSRETY